VGGLKLGLVEVDCFRSKKEQLNTSSLLQHTLAGLPPYPPTQSFPSKEEKKNQTCLRTLTCKLRQESGLDCHVRAIFARQRNGSTQAWRAFNTKLYTPYPICHTPYTPNPQPTKSNSNSASCNRAPGVTHEKDRRAPNPETSAGVVEKSTAPRHLFLWDALGSHSDEP